MENNFKSIVEFIDDFNKNLNEYNKNIIYVAIENDDNCFVKKIDVFNDGINDKLNNFLIEKIVKSMLYMIGGYNIYIYNSNSIYNYIKNVFESSFDSDFMGKVYDQKIKVINQMPISKYNSINIKVDNKNKRIGLDIGGSDIKISVFDNDSLIYQNQYPWNPIENDNIIYFHNTLLDILISGISYINDVNKIYISSAGIIKDNKVKIASMFKKLNSLDYQYIYIDIISKLEKKLNHKIEFKVFNDGDIACLSYGLAKTLGLALGTSLASGFIDKNNNLTTYLNEFATTVVDVSDNAIYDDYYSYKGLACKYLSQQGIIYLAKQYNIDLSNLSSDKDKLSYIQELVELNDKNAIEIFDKIGTILGYSIVFYKYFYDFDNVILLGRVMSNSSGNIILNACNKIIFKKYQINSLNIILPEENDRKLAQSYTVANIK